MPMNLDLLLARQARAFVARVLLGHEGTEQSLTTFQTLGEFPFGRQFHAHIAARLAQDTYRLLEGRSDRLDPVLLQRFLALGAMLQPDHFAQALEDLGERWGAPERRLSFPPELRMALGRASRSVGLSLAHRHRLSQTGLPAADDPVWDR